MDTQTDSPRHRIRPPRSVMLVGWLFIAAGTFGILYHAGELTTDAGIDVEHAWVLVLRMLASVGGVFVLRGADWARWLLLAWMLYHTVLSAFHSISELAIHIVILAGVAYVLFRPHVRAYFRG